MLPNFHSLKNNFKSVEGFMLLYTLVVFALSFLGSGSINALFGLPLLFFVPYLVGQMVYLIFLRTRFILVESWEVQLFVFWVSGALLLAFTYILLQILGLFIIIKYGHLIWIAVLFVFYILATPKRPERKFVDLDIQDIYYLVGLSLVVAFAFYISRLHMLFPLPHYDFVTVHSVYLVLKRAVEDGFFLHRRMGWLAFVLVVTQISGADILVLMWFGVVFEMYLFCFGFYLLAKTLLGRRNIAFIAVVFGIFVLSYNGLYMNNFFTERPEFSFYPSITLRALLPWWLYVIYKIFVSNKDFLEYKLRNFLSVLFLVTAAQGALVLVCNIITISERLGIQDLLLALYMTLTLRVIAISIFALLLIRWARRGLLGDLLVYVLLPSLTFVIFHESEPILYFLVIDAFLILYWLANRHDTRALAIISLTAVFVYVSLQALGIIEIPDLDISKMILPIPKNVTRPFSVKFESLMYALPPIPLAILLVGSASMSMLKNKNLNIVAISVALTTFIYFFPDVMSYRINFVMTLFYALALAEGVFTLAEAIDRTVITKIEQNLATGKASKFRFHAKRLVVVVLVIIAIVPLINIFYLRYAEHPRSYSYHTKIAYYEYELAQWIEKNTGKTDIIISDPFTMFVVNSLANRLFLVQPVMHVWVLTDYEYEKILVIDKLYRSSTPDEAIDKILELTKYRLNYLDHDYVKKLGLKLVNITIYIVYTSRTVVWLKSPSLDLVYTPQFIPLDPTYEKSFEEPYFKLAHESKYYKIYRTTIPITFEKYR